MGDNRKFKNGGKRQIGLLGNQLSALKAGNNLVGDAFKNRAHRSAFQKLVFLQSYGTWPGNKQDSEAILILELSMKLINGQVPVLDEFIGLVTTKEGELPPGS